MSAIDMHPSPAELSAFALGSLADSTQHEIEQHLEQCPECQRTAANAPADTFVELLRSVRAAGDTPAPLHTLPTSPVIPPELTDHPRYRLRRPLGAGGMGTVWLAEHKVMGRLVALKVIRPGFLTRPDAAERFRREARAAASLRHPNIVTAFDAEQAGGLHLLVMEYLEGETLAAHLARTGPLPPDEACRITREVAFALQHAHDHGLTHRDLKPHNIMLTPEGAKVLDLGLAAFTSAADDSLTGANMVVGTPDYIAPEQAEDPRCADARSDIYSLGCTLYQMLTGRVPFPGDSVLRKLDAHRGQHPDALPKHLPPGLADVVATMMAKDPHRRQASAAQVAHELDRFAAGGDAFISRERNGGRRLLVALAFFFFFAIVAGVVIRVQTGEGEVVIETQRPDVQVVLMQGGKEVQIIDAKTQQRVAVPVGGYDVALKNKPEGLEVKTEKIRVRRGEETLVTIEYVAKPSPAGEKSPRVAEGKLIRVIPHEVGSRPFVAQPLSHHGRIVVLPILGAAGQPDRLRVVEAESGNVIREVILETGELIAYCLSPDGKRVVTATRSNVVGRALSQLQEWDLETGQARILQLPERTPRTVMLLRFSENGQRLVLMSPFVPPGIPTAFVIETSNGKSWSLSAAGEEKPGRQMAAWLSPSGRYAASVTLWLGADGKSANNSIVRIEDLSRQEPARELTLSYRVAGLAFRSEDTVSLVGSTVDDGNWVDTWNFKASGQPVRQKLGGPGRGMIQLDRRASRAAMSMSDGSVRVESVGGWTSAVFATEPLKNVRRFWLSGQGNVLAVQTDKELRLYQLPEP